MQFTYKDLLRTRKGKIILVVILIIAAIIGYKVWLYYRPYDISQGWDGIRTETDITKYRDALIDAYAKDTIGFATPEETFNAFREALKAGKYDLAASYFVPEKQKEMRTRFNNPKYVESVVPDLYLENTKHILNDEEIYFETVPAYQGLGYNFDLVKNTRTGVWKMLSL